MDVDFDDLRALLALADMLHFGRAADRLHISQPALSKRLRRMEERIGGPLLVRGYRDVRLTDAGRLLANRGRHLIGEASAAIALTQRAARGEAGLLRIGFGIASIFGLLPDVLHYADTPCIGEMIAAHAERPGNYIAVAPVPADQAHQYGIVGVEDAKAKTSRITQMVEKPKPGTAPSNLHISGRYILEPEMFAILDAGERGAGGEIQITDAMIRLAKKQPFYGLKFKGRSFDCGSKVGFLAANVAYALERDDIAPAFRAEIRKLLREK